MTNDSVSGDFFGMGSDNNYYLPYNVSSMVDVLEAKNISWASYREYGRLGSGRRY